MLIEIIQSQLKEVNMNAAWLQSMARSIASKAAAKRGDSFDDAAIGKIISIIRQIQILSERTDLPEENLVLIVQKNSGEPVAEYGLIMFVLQNMLDLGYFQDDDIWRTIILIFRSVRDLRDHSYRFGKCGCWSCRRRRRG